MSFLFAHLSICDPGSHRWEWYVLPDVPICTVTTLILRPLLITIRRRSLYQSNRIVQRAGLEPATHSFPFEFAVSETGCSTFLYHRSTD